MTVTGGAASRTTLVHLPRLARSSAGPESACRSSRPRPFLVGGSLVAFPGAWQTDKRHVAKSLQINDAVNFPIRSFPS